MLITEHQFKAACFLYFIFTEKLKTLGSVDKYFLLYYKTGLWANWDDALVNGPKYRMLEYNRLFSIS